jgi:hypothetical protein
MERRAADQALQTPDYSFPSFDRRVAFRSRSTGGHAYTRRDLLRLEGNLNHYDKQVPNFFCNEHVVSSLTYGQKRQSTVTDSVFRVTRALSGTLAESREIKAVNGTPANVERVGGPVSLSGVFSGGLYAVSLRQKACMSYILQPIQSGHSGEPYVIQFTTLPNTKRRSECVLKEEGEWPSLR